MAAERPAIPSLIDEGDGQRAGSRIPNTTARPRIWFSEATRCRAAAYAAKRAWRREPRRRRRAAKALGERKARGRRHRADGRRAPRLLRFRPATWSAHRNLRRAHGGRRFQLHMAKQPMSAGFINAAIAALRFFFTVTLERPDLVLPLTTVNKPRRAPVVLSQEEVARLLEAAPGLKYKAALIVAYGAGLRVSEVANLKVSDIDSQRITLRVEQGKGQRDRYVMLSPQLLERPCHGNGSASRFAG